MPIKAFIRLAAVLGGLAAGLIIGFQTIPKNDIYMWDRAKAVMDNRPPDATIPMYDLSQSDVHSHLVWHAIGGTSAGLLVGWLLLLNKKPSK